MAEGSVRTASPIQIRHAEFGRQQHGESMWLCGLHKGCSEQSMHTLQGNFLHVQHVNLGPKVVEDAGLLTCNVASTHNHHPAPHQACSCVYCLCHPSLTNPGWDLCGWHLCSNASLQSGIPLLTCLQKVCPFVLLHQVMCCTQHLQSS